MGGASHSTHTFFNLISFRGTFFAWTHEQILVYRVITYDEVHIFTTRKKLINDTFNASLKSYNDAFLKRHGLACHCKSLHTMTLILSVIFVNQNYDIHLKRHSLLVIFQSNNLTMTLI